MRACIHSVAFLQFSAAHSPMFDASAKRHPDAYPHPRCAFVVCCVVLSAMFLMLLALMDSPNLRRPLSDEEVLQMQIGQGFLSSMSLDAGLWLRKREGGAKGPPIIGAGAEIERPGPPATTEEPEHTKELRVSGG